MQNQNILSIFAPTINGGMADTQTKFTMLPDRLTESNSIEISKKEARAIVDALQFLFISQKFDDETGHYATTGEVTGMMHPVTRDFLRMITYKLNQA